MSPQDDVWPVWFLLGLLVVAMAVVGTGLFLWFFRAPGAGPITVSPTATPLSEAHPATMTPAPTSVAERRATFAAPTERPTAEIKLTPTSTVEPTATTPELPPVTATATAAATPSLIGDTGTIEGRITLQGRSTSAGITLLVNGAPVDTTDASGAFRLVVPAGRVGVRASYPGYLEIEASDVEVRVGEVARLPAVSLRAGDTDRDGDVDLFDVVRCAINFGHTMPAADAPVDLTGDGVVDVRELILAQQNYRAISPAPWQ